VIVVASRPEALARAGGRTILGRLAEMLRRAGRSPDGILAAPELAAAVADELATWPDIECPVLEPAELGCGDDPILFFDGAVVYDGRLIDEAAGWRRPTALFDAGGFAGVALAPAGAAPSLDLERLSADPAIARRDIDEIPTYSRSLRRDLRPFALPIRGPDDIAAVRQTLAAAAGKGHMEWYVVAFNRPIEQWLSRHLAETRITPNQITFISNVTAYAATALLALGHLAAAFAFIVATGILDGLDGRQARIQIKTSKVGEWEHVFDALSELSWMVALGWYISAGFSEPLPAAATAAWIAFYAADNYSYTFFRLRRHMMIDEASPIDAAIRFVASRRNTSFAYFFIIAALGYPAGGFLAVVAFAGLSAAVHWVRVATLLSR
jgi:phosphatidylglycerophosphate synthase